MARMRVTNNTDLTKAAAGELTPDRVRSVEVEALVDTGATMLVLPADVVAHLGLREEGQRSVKYADGRIARVPRVTGVRIEILGRDMTCDALVESAGTALLS